MSDFQKWSVLAFRAMDDAGRVLMTIEPESTTEGERLDQLKETIRELLMQALLLNGVWTRRQLDERFQFGKLDSDWLNVQLGQEQQAEPVCRNCIGTGWEPSMYDGRRPCGFCQSAPLQPQPQQQAEPLADGAIHAAWSAGYVEGEKAALEQQAEPFSPEVINTTQTAWKMGYEAAKAEQQQAEPVGQLQECLYGRGQVLWFEKPADLSMLYTAPPQQQAEPVAYLSYKPIPLYTYTISPQRKQLTVERIHHLCSAFHQWSEWDDASYRQLWVDLVRSVEADHDIKEGA